MSRFFAAGDSSSESSSSEEEELYSDEEEERQPAQEKGSSDEESDEDEDEDEDESSSEEGGPVGVSRFLRDAASSDEESSDSDTPKVVKSAKSKRFEELESTIKLIDNAMKINDWNSISNEFDKLNRQVLKVQAPADNRPPKPYVKIVADLEDFLYEAIERQKGTPKKMTATNARGLNAMKQKIKRTSKEYTTEVSKYREDKADYMMSEEEEDVQPATKKQRAAAPTVEGDAGEDEQGFSTVGQGGRTLRYTPESILAHLRTIGESRGKKNTDRTSQIQVMERLLAVAATPYQRIRVLLSLVSTRFDLTSGSTSSYMSQEQWRLADSELGQLLEVLEQNRDIVVVENAEAWEDDEKPPQVVAGKKLQVPGSIASMVERLDDELTRSLQHTDPHAAEYIDRLTDEQSLYGRILRTLLYVEEIKSDKSLGVSQDNVNRVVMRRLEHVYFKPAQVVTILEEKAWASVPKNLDSRTTPRGTLQDVESLVSALCTYLFEKSTDIIRGRAYLCQVYYQALHDQYYRARDMLLMSHLQETISNFDISTQILFNRTLVQVG